MNVQPSGNPGDIHEDGNVRQRVVTLAEPNLAGADLEERSDVLLRPCNHVQVGLVGPTDPVDDSTETFEERPELPGISKNLDINFYNSLFCIDPNRLSDEERAYTDEFLESLTLVKLRDLAGKMAHEIWEGAKKNKKNTKDGIPIHGTKSLVLGKILAYYLFMREERTTDRDREVNTAPTFQPEEDARLIEILTDPQIYPDIKFAFQSGTRADIDSVQTGSLVDLTWNAVIAGRYFNNFQAFQPPHRHHDQNDVLHAYDPNKANICRRTGTSLKSRFSTIRSRCTVINQRWSDSGSNDPERFEGFCLLHIPLDRSAFYMWLRIQEGGSLISSRLLRLVPVGNDSRKSTRNNGELLRIMQGRETAADDSDKANNKNNGGAIGKTAQKSQHKKKRRQDDNDSMANIAETLAAIADPKGRQQARRAQMISMLDGLNSKMNKLSEELDPDGAALMKRGFYISRRRKLYREARKRRWVCQRELEALEAGHDNVSMLPPEAEPTTDSDEAEFLQDEVGSDLE